MKPALQVVTPPASEPVSAAELYAHLKLNTGNAEYPELTKFIASARQLFEKHTGRAVLPTAFRQTMARLCGEIELVWGGVLTVEAVGYFDPSGAEQELDGWELDAVAVPAVVYMPEGAWPVVSATKRRPAWVDFTAGWSTAADVPDLVTTAIKLMAGHWYRFREAYTEVPLKELPSGFRSVVELYDTALNRGA